MTKLFSMDSALFSSLQAHLIFYPSGQKGNVRDMTRHNSFAIIGGDSRQIRLANALAADGYSVTVYGFDSDTEFLHLPVAATLEDALEPAGVVVLPLPATYDGSHVNTPLYRGLIEVDVMLQALKKNQILLAGMIDTQTATLIDIYNVYAIDYFEREELTVLNAIPTAEGGIELAMHELPTTLHGSKCLVLGYGRVANVLAHMLHGIGAKVTVAARRHDALAWVDAHGYTGKQIGNLKNYIGQYDVVFNSIPSKILTREILECVHSNTLIIDLASKPGGVDMTAAQELGLKAIWALSLPGKVAPITAGDIIKKAVLNICAELGV